LFSSPTSIVALSTFQISFGLDSLLNQKEIKKAATKQSVLAASLLEKLKKRQQS
jgi:hypothetical protein